MFEKHTKILLLIFLRHQIGLPVVSFFIVYLLQKFSGVIKLWAYTFLLVKDGTLFMFTSYVKCSTTTRYKYRIRCNKNIYKYTNKRKEKQNKNWKTTLWVLCNSYIQFVFSRKHLFLSDTLIVMLLQYWSFEWY